MRFLNDVHRAAEGSISGTTRTGGLSRSGAVERYAPPPNTFQTPEQRARKIALLLQIRRGDVLPAEIIESIEALVLAEIQAAVVSAHIVTLGRCRMDLDVAMNRSGRPPKSKDEARVMEKARAVKDRWGDHQKRWEAML